MSQLFAFAAPILPDKFEQWEQFVNKLNTEYYEDFKELRYKYGLRERSYHQKGQNFDTVIVTLEGDNPMESFNSLLNDKSPFSTWFIEQVKEIHGFDLTSPQAGPPPQLIIDSHR